LRYSFSFFFGIEEGAKNPDMAPLISLRKRPAKSERKTFCYYFIVTDRGSFLLQNVIVC
jgi:hypothetical protein